LIHFVAAVSFAGDQTGIVQDALERASVAGASGFDARCPLSRAELTGARYVPRDLPFVELRHMPMGASATGESQAEQSSDQSANCSGRSHTDHDLRRSRHR
jgi:hypothetical protein